MVFITLVCSYLSSTLLKINAEQIIKLSSPNLGKSFALIAAVKAKSPNPESPLPLSDLVWGAGSEDFLAGVGSPYWRPEVPSWDRGSLTWGWDADGWGPLRGLSGTVAPSPSYIHRHTHRMHTNTHRLFHTHTHTPYSLLLGAGAFCLAPEGPCHRPEWTPCPRRAGQLQATHAPGLSGSCPGHQC